MNAALNAGLSQAELEQLATRLDANPNQDGLSLEGVDGFFCALIASPVTVPPSEYMPVILGGEPGESGVFADLDDANATLSLLMRYWNSIIADMEREEVHLPFVFEAQPGEVPGREWALGFMSGTDFAPEDWDELFEDESEDDLFVIPLAAGVVETPWPTVPVTAEFQDDVLQSMAVGFARSYRHFSNARRGVADVQTFVRPEPKVGRNDACPCGSGKKYKKCCGAGSTPTQH